jgi:hypothetical protein
MGCAVAFVRANVVHALAKGGQWFSHTPENEAKTCNKENCDIFEKCGLANATARAQT